MSPPAPQEPQRQDSTGYRWFVTVFAGFVLLFALNLPLNIVRLAWLERDLALNGQPATARVTSEQTCRTKAGPVRCLELEYPVGDKTYRDLNATRTLKVGDSVPLHCAPSDPTVYHLEISPPRAPWNQDLMPRVLLASALGLIFGLAAIAQLVQTWKR